MENGKSFLFLPLFQPSLFFFFFLFHLADQNSFPRPRNFLPAGPFPRLLAQPAQRPLPLPDSPPGGPRLSGASSSPTEPDSSLSPTRPRAPPRPTRARTPRRQPRPYKRNPRPLEAPNRSRSRRLRKNLVAPPPLLKLLGALPRRRSASYSRRHRCSGAPPW